MSRPRKNRGKHRNSPRPPTPKNTSKNTTDTTKSTTKTPPNPSCKKPPSNKPTAMDDLIPFPLQRPKPHTSQPPGLLRLPPEVRWQIYTYLFPSQRVDIIRRRDTDNPARQNRYRLYHSVGGLTSRRPQRRRTMTRLALALTCRTTYRETILQLYATTAFVFHSTRAMARFLRSTTVDAQAAIRDLSIHHVMYSEPRLTEFRRYKHRSDLAFFDACTAMARAFTALRVLRVDLVVNDWPIRLHVDERWAWPVAVFARCGHGLDDVAVRLTMKRFERARLRAVASELEKMLMKPGRFEERESVRRTAPEKAKRVLKLVL
ncbi:hypothetical protein BDV59DRAFT_205389 [Aspergillus ambiguus]|uniref:uncharacterized protein n=1 Tax=Aspergillus ambiguus TaxID=176160 RepID=UPI003CCD1177